MSRNVLPAQSNPKIWSYLYVAAEMSTKRCFSRSPASTLLAPTSIGKLSTPEIALRFRFRRTPISASGSGSNANPPRKNPFPPRQPRLQAPQPWPHLRPAFSAPAFSHPRSKLKSSKRKSAPRISLTWPITISTALSSFPWPRFSSWLPPPPPRPRTQALAPNTSPTSPSKAL